MENMTFGERLYAEMQMKGVSQGKLAKKSGVAQTTISMYVNGKSSPRLKTVSRLCNALGISPSKLLDGTVFESEEQS